MLIPFYIPLARHAFDHLAQFLDSKRRLCCLVLLAVFMVRRSARMILTSSNSSNPHTYYEDIYLLSDASEQGLMENSYSTISLDMPLGQPQGEQSISSVSDGPSIANHSEAECVNIAPRPLQQSKKESSSHSLRQSRRLSLQVSNDLHRQLKIIALEDEETMNSLIVGVLRNYLQERQDAFQRLQRSSRR